MINKLLLKKRKKPKKDIKKKEKNMVTLDDLEEEYKQKLKDDPSQEGSEVAWKWFVKEKKEKIDDEYDAIFRILMVPARQNGMDLYYAYILDEITPTEYFWGLVNDSGQLYMDTLVSEEMVEEEDIYDILEDVSLQALKGTDTIGKLEELPDREDPEQEELRDEIDRVGSIIWWNFVEELHQQVKLPKVKKLKDFLYTAIEVEAEVIELDDFKEFKLSSSEEEYYRELVGLD